SAPRAGCAPWARSPRTVRRRGRRPARSVRPPPPGGGPRWRRRPWSCVLLGRLVGQVLVAAQGAVPEGVELVAQGDDAGRVEPVDASGALGALLDETAGRGCAHRAGCA